MRDEQLDPQNLPAITLTYESGISNTIQVDRHLDPIISCRECCHCSRLEGDDSRLCCRQHVDEKGRHTWIPSEDFQCDYFYPNIKALQEIDYFEKIEYENLRPKPELGGDEDV